MKLNSMITMKMTKSVVIEDGRNSRDIVCGYGNAIILGLKHLQCHEKYLATYTRDFASKAQERRTSAIRTSFKTNDIHGKHSLIFEQ